MAKFPLLFQEQATSSLKEPGLPKVAIIVMVYNESVFLPVWYKYYSEQLGRDNLFVIDHSSTDHSTDFINTNKIKIPQGELDEITRKDFIISFHKSLLEYFDFVIYTDCDEFIVPRPDLYDSLLDYIAAHRSTPIIRCAGVDVVQDDPKAPPLDFSQPLLKQRHYGHFSHYSCKPLVASVPVNWVPGFHDCEGQDAFLDTDLWLFHMKLIDTGYALKRLALTRSKPWSKRAHDSGHGFSHRVDNNSLEVLIAALQRSYQKGTLNPEEFYKQFLTKEDTPLLQIPEMFWNKL